MERTVTTELINEFITGTQEYGDAEKLNRWMKDRLGGLTTDFIYGYWGDNTEEVFYDETPGEKPYEVRITTVLKIGLPEGPRYYKCEFEADEYEYEVSSYKMYEVKPKEIITIVYEPQ